MTLDEFFRDQISRGQPPMVALHNAAQAYADILRKRPDCSQYADENVAWGGRVMSAFVPWHVAVDTSRQDEFGNGPQGIAITPHEDDVADAIAWMQEGTYEDAVVMAKSRETAKTLIEAVELLREQCQRMCRWRENGVGMTAEEISWHDRVLKFLEGKQ